MAARKQGRVDQTPLTNLHTAIFHGFHVKVMKSPPPHTHTTPGSRLISYSHAGELTDPLSPAPIRSCLHVPHLKRALHKLEGNPVKSPCMYPPVRRFVLKSLSRTPKACLRICKCAQHGAPAASRLISGAEHGSASQPVKAFLFLSPLPLAAAPPQ